MGYEIGDGFIDIINQNKKRLIGQFFFQIVMIIAYTFKLYPAAYPAILLFIFSELVIIGFFVFYHYEETIKPGRMVNKMAYKVSLNDKQITVETIPFKVLFWINKPSQMLTFNIDELKIKKTSNPLPYFRINNKIFFLSDKQKEAYILFDYFNPELEEKLNEILVEVTPEYLLVPGRLRHH